MVAQAASGGVRAHAAQRESRLPHAGRTARAGGRGEAGRGGDAVARCGGGTKRCCQRAARDTLCSGGVIRHEARVGSPVCTGGTPLLCRAARCAACRSVRDKIQQEASSEPEQCERMKGKRARREACAKRCIRREAGKARHQDTLMAAAQRVRQSVKRERWKAGGPPGESARYGGGALPAKIRCAEGGAQQHLIPPEARTENSSAA